MESAPISEHRRRRWIAPLAILVVAGAALGLTRVVADGDDGIDSVVLDEPGEYQEPGIGTNRDVVGEALAAADVEGDDGTDVSTAEWTVSGRPLVVNVWFSTCQPCRREMPVLQRAFESYGDRVDFIGVNPQDTRGRMLEFADDVGVTYRLFRDPNGSFTVANGIATFPTTFFVAADGRVTEQIAGELSEAELEGALTRLVAP